MAITAGVSAEASTGGGTAAGAVDILFVVDNSGSMAYEQAGLRARPGVESRKLALKVVRPSAAGATAKVEMLLFELLREANTDTFREIARLVK